MCYGLNLSGIDVLIVGGAILTTLRLPLNAIIWKESKQMGRPIFEIYFNCKCGISHGTKVFVAFVHPPTPTTSVADVCGNQPLPPQLDSFLSKPFQCEENQDVTELPGLEHFFYAFTGDSTMMVG